MDGDARGDIRDVETIAFLLVPNFSMIAFTSAVEPLRIANRLSGRTLYRWPLISKDGAPVVASNGISVQVDLANDRPRARGRRRPAHGPALERHRRRALSGSRGLRLAPPPGQPGRDARGALHRRPCAGPRGALERPPLHDPLGEPAGLHRGFSRHRGQRRPFRDRRQAADLLGRHRSARPHALPDRRASRPAAGDQGVGAVPDGPDPRAARPPAAADPHAAGGPSPEARDGASS